MHNIQIGTMVLNGTLVLYFTLGVTGWLIMKYRLRRVAERDSIIACTANAFWLWLIVWKGSYIIFHPVEFIHQPVALLYFDGGSRGIWIANLISALYIGYRSWRHNWSYQIWMKVGVWLIFGCWFVYHSLLIAIGEESIYHAASAALSLGFLIHLFRSQNRTDTGKEASYVTWFSIGNVLLMFIVTNRPLWWLTFSKQQIIFLLTALFITGLSFFAEKMKKEGKHG
ncbi:hypothetical protein [Paenibacillus glucanolyticus]|uniref:hypothetical protein n=1 Tax=Paenibacillus glucanolyticus TaxID=59843 RepID=UPI00096FEC74|nr:hypothetical protein [Paenibacillus glucanolyticus]OMF80903.1 hypothetical protein BK142_05700 [Paenibacillus glucanolyticus]